MGKEKSRAKLKAGTDRGASHPVGIVGLGAMGTSIGLALRSANVETLGFDASAGNLQEAFEMGAIDGAACGLGSFECCRVVFVAVPPGQVVEVAQTLLGITGASIVDVASVKGDIARAVTHPRFVPSHPIRGTHLSGPTAAKSNLFTGAVWAMCPTGFTSARGLNAVEGLIRLMGAEPLRMSAGDHDRMIATASHLPHVAASSLVHVLGKRDPLAFRLVAGGFTDTTRIARANPDLWAEITMFNRAAVSPAIDDLIELLTRVKAALGRQDRKAMLAFFSEACSSVEKWLPPRIEKDAVALADVSAGTPALNRGRPLVPGFGGGVQ